METGMVEYGHHDSRCFTFLTPEDQQAAIERNIESTLHSIQTVNGALNELAASLAAREDLPQKLQFTVSISGLEEHRDGILYGSAISFVIIQNGKVLLEDRIEGKCSGTYQKTYEVEASDEEIELISSRSNCPLLVISAAFV